MEQRKQEFFAFAIILTIIGFLQYLRRIISGYKLSRNGKILYLCTMIVFTLSVIYIFYLTDISNVITFFIGLAVSVLSEHIAKLFMIIGDNFNAIISKCTNRYLKIDLTEQLCGDKKKTTDTKVNDTTNKEKS